MKRIGVEIVMLVLCLMVARVSSVLAQGNDEILARVGNEVITRIDFETRVKSLPPSIQEALKNPEKKRQLLDNMVRARLMVLEGEKKGLNERADIVANLKMIRDDYITKEYVNAYLGKEGEVSDEEALSYYNSDPEMKEQEMLKASEIVVETEDEAKAVLERLKKGEPFKKLVMEKSKGMSRTMGGELEWFEKGKGEKEIEAAVEKLDKGGISDIVKTKDRYVIYKLEDRKTVPKPSFLKRKDEIIGRLKYKKVFEWAEKEAEELKKKTAVETFYDKLSPEGK